MSEQQDLVFQSVEEDLESGALLPVTLVWSEVFRQAEKLSVKHTSKLGARSLDLLHVAAAVQLAAKIFVTFDKRQHVLAEKVGLQVRP